VEEEVLTAGARIGSYEVIDRLGAGGIVWGAVFDKDGARVLTWSFDGAGCGYAIAMNFPVKLLPLKVRLQSGTRLTATGDLEALSPSEWQLLKRDHESRLLALHVGLVTEDLQGRPGGPRTSPPRRDGVPRASC